MRVLRSDFSRYNKEEDAIDNEMVSLLDQQKIL